MTRGSTVIWAGVWRSPSATTGLRAFVVFIRTGSRFTELENVFIPTLRRCCVRQNREGACDLLQLEVRLQTPAFQPACVGKLQRSDGVGGPSAPLCVSACRTTRGTCEIRSRTGVSPQLEPPRKILSLFPQGRISAAPTRIRCRKRTQRSRLPGCRFVHGRQRHRKGECRLAGSLAGIARLCDSTENATAGSASAVRKCTRNISVMVTGKP